MEFEQTAIGEFDGCTNPIVKATKLFREKSGLKQNLFEFEFCFINSKNCAVFSLKHREIEWRIWRRRTVTLTLLRYKDIYKSWLS